MGTPKDELFPAAIVGVHQVQDVIFIEMWGFFKSLLYLSQLIIFWLLFFFTKNRSYIYLIKKVQV